LFYLDQLEKMGIQAKGELLFSEEKKKESVVLTDENHKQLHEAISEIQKIAKYPVPPPPKKNQVLPFMCLPGILLGR